MTAMNIVHARVKPGHEQEFVAYQEGRSISDYDGCQSMNLVKTGDREYTYVGIWDSMDALVAARPKMIETLDGMRHMLEGGQGEETQPRSGDVVVSKSR